MSRAFEHGDLTLVYPIARSTPAFLPLISVPLLGESISAGAALRHRDRGGGDLARRRRRADSRARPSRRRPRASPCSRWRPESATRSSTRLAMTRLAAAAWTSPLPRAFVYAVLLGISGGAVFAPLAWLRTRGRILERVRAAELGARELRLARQLSRAMRWCSRRSRPRPSATWWRCARRACSSRSRWGCCGCARRPAGRACGARSRPSSVSR